MRQVFCLAYMLDFLMMVFDRYYSIVKPICKSVATNHMYLGIRVVTAFYESKGLMQVLGCYCDVIAVNYCHHTVPDTQNITDIQNWTDKPFMLTEWYAKGMDACNSTTGLTNSSGSGWTVKTQNDRGIFYESFALKLWECKYCVGFDWFCYVDNDPGKTGADSSNTSSNKGIVSAVGAYSLTNDMAEYSDLTKHMNTINNAKYSLIRFFDERNS